MTLPVTLPVTPPVAPDRLAKAGSSALSAVVARYLPPGGLYATSRPVVDKGALPSAAAVKFTMSPADFATLRKLAARRKVKVSAILRGWVIEALQRETASPDGSAQP